MLYLAKNIGQRHFLSALTQCKQSVVDQSTRPCHVFCKRHCRQSGSSATAAPPASTQTEPATTATQLQCWQYSQLQRRAQGQCQMANAKWPMLNGHAEGRFRMANAEWQMPNGKCQMANAKWQMPNG